MEGTIMPKHTPSDQQRQHVRAWQRSGVAVPDFARRLGVHPKTLRRWIDIHQHEPHAEHAFVEIPQSEDSPSPVFELEFTAPDGLRCHLGLVALPPAGWTAELLRAVVAS